MIIKAKYLDEEYIEVTLENGNSMSCLIDNEEVREFIANGGIIEPKFTDEELLQTAKDTKIASIDSKTATDIELLVGDNNKQKDLLATYNYLLEQKLDGAITSDEQVSMATIKGLWFQVSDLKESGNTRELQVENVDLADYASLELALLAVEAI